VSYSEKDGQVILTMSREERTVCQVSCGAASAVAAKLILAENPHAMLVNAFVRQEHEDNRRFLADCEKWFGRPVMVVWSEKYDASTYQVWLRKRFMKGRRGAPCSQELKRKAIAPLMRPDDIVVIGYTADERDADRAINLEQNFPNAHFRFPLIERGLKHANCLAIIERAGIVLPLMYRLGYQNANCIGCVKGGEGYWNKIRRDFPEQFVQIANIQEEIGPGAYLFRNRQTGGRFSLKDLDPEAGRYQDEPEISCGFVCAMAEDEIETGRLNSGNPNYTSYQTGEK
jgi:hypothetical protein